MMRLLSALGFILLLITDKAYAAEIESADSSGMLLVRVLFYLGIVLFIIYFLFWFFVKKNKIGRSSMYKHLGGVPLGQNKSLQIVEVGNKVYLLGVGEDVKLVKVLEEDVDIESVKETVNEQNMQVNNVTHWLSGKLTPLVKKKKTSNQFEDELVEKMEQLKEKRIQSVNQYFKETIEGEGDNKHHE